MDYIKLFNDLDNELQKLGDKNNDNRFLYNRLSVMRSATRQILKEDLSTPDQHNYNELIAYIDEVNQLKEQINKDSSFHQWLEDSVFTTETYIDHIMSRAL